MDRAFGVGAARWDLELHSKDAAGAIAPDEIQ